LPCKANISSLLLAFPQKMKKTLLLVLVLLATTLASAVAQNRPSKRKSVPAGRGRSEPKDKGETKPPPEYAPIITQQASKEEAPAMPAFVGKIKLKRPVLVYYEQPEPGQSVQQLIMAEANLGLLKTMSLEQLMARREVYVDGLGNLPLPGSDISKYRLIGTSVVAEETRRPAGDGRSTYSRLKVPSSGPAVRGARTSRGIPALCKRAPEKRIRP
jgi:hypothetical protein